MSWSRQEQIRAERAWFHSACEEIGWKCGGSLISGRRTRNRNTEVGGHPGSLHMDGLAEDWEFDTAVGYGNAWEMRKQMGLHGYKKPATRGIHWQARPAKRVSGPR